MRNVSHFVEKVVTVEYNEQIESYGHYPFKQFVEQVDGQCLSITLDFGGDVSACYSEFAKQFKKKARRIYLSVDFPSCGDIGQDFVAIFSYENEQTSVYAIPYDYVDGTKSQIIYEGTTINQLLEDLKKFINQVLIV